MRAISPKNSNFLFKYLDSELNTYFSVAFADAILSLNELPKLVFIVVASPNIPERLTDFEEKYNTETFQMFYLPDTESNLYFNTEESIEKVMISIKHCYLKYTLKSFYDIHYINGERVH